MKSKQFTEEESRMIKDRREMLDMGSDTRTHSNKDAIQDLIRDRSLGRQHKDKLWIHRTKMWDIKHKRFMHKLP